jgi:hypothetical protein
MPKATGADDFDASPDYLISCGGAHFRRHSRHAEKE